MLTVYRFKSNAFHPTAAELDETHEDFINPGIFARQLADFLKDGLQRHGYEVKLRCAEDWGFWQEIDHESGYMLAVGCANLDDDGGAGRVTEHRVFVEPDRPTIRPASNWFRKTDVRADVEALVAAIGEVLRAEPQIFDLEVSEA